MSCARVTRAARVAANVSAGISRHPLSLCEACADTRIVGGHAYIIPGELALARRPDLHQPATPQRAPLWRRLLGRSAGSDVARISELPNGDRFFDMPPGTLKDALVTDLRAWLHSRMPKPSAGTAVVLDHLTQIEPSVYVRGLQKRGHTEPEFYVQVSFSGCAGQAETSARATAHWTSFWYASEQARIATAYSLHSGSRLGRSRGAKKKTCSSCRPVSTATSSTHWVRATRINRRSTSTCRSSKRTKTIQ